MLSRGRQKDNVTSSISKPVFTFLERVIEFLRAVLCSVRLGRRLVSALRLRRICFVVISIGLLGLSCIDEVTSVAVSLSQTNVATLGYCASRALYSDFFFECVGCTAFVQSFCKHV